MRILFTLQTLRRAHTLKRFIFVIAVSFGPGNSRIPVFRNPANKRLASLSTASFLIPYYVKPALKALNGKKQIRTLFSVGPATPF
jgi:hypothetical protein